MTDSTGFFALDTNDLPWEHRANPRVPGPIYRKLLHTDEETGVLFQLVRYPRGVVNPDHTHPCAHAIFVLEGTLVTHKGRFGPGSFVWFPEGEVMWHGATAEDDVTVLLVSNKPFSIHHI
jgi:quercetin dioxygenase-like cupin family protein